MWCSAVFPLVITINQHLVQFIQTSPSRRISLCSSSALWYSEDLQQCSRKMARDQVDMRLRCFCPIYRDMTTVTAGLIPTPDTLARHRHTRTHTHTQGFSTPLTMPKYIRGDCVTPQGGMEKLGLSLLALPSSSSPSMSRTDGDCPQPLSLPPWGHATFHIQPWSCPKIK